MIPQHPLLRNGVDVYRVDEGMLAFVYTSTRKRILVACRPELTRALQFLNGRRAEEEILALCGAVRDEDPAGHLVDQVLRFLAYLSDLGIVVDADWTEALGLPSAYVAQMDRHLTYLLDLVGSARSVATVQKAIYDSTVSVIGVGAVGRRLCELLPMVGFRSFRLIDRQGDQKSQGDKLGVSRLVDAESKIRERAFRARVETYGVAVSPTADLDGLLRGSGIVVNTADEPYIGYTNVILSRYCITNNIPLMACGGFPAHLGCFGELIVPGVTPCADCYVDYFKTSLANWRPSKHPVEDRSRATGRLPALACFSAAQAVNAIVRYFAQGPDAMGGRKELLFGDYSVVSFSVERDRTCALCGTGTSDPS